MLDINRSPQPSNILSNIITEDNRPHRRLPGATLTHQQHLSLLLASVHCVRFPPGLGEYPARGYRGTDGRKDKEALGVAIECWRGISNSD